MDDEELRSKVYHYRMAGESIPAIAARLGITKMRAAAVYREYATEMAKVATDDDRKNDLALELDRLDRLQEGLWTQATEEHKVPMRMGSGKDQYMEIVDMPPDPAAVKGVLDIMKQRATLRGWDKLDAKDGPTLTAVLIAGDDTRSFLEALQAGQKRPELTSEHRDNDIEGEAVQVEEFTT